MSDDIFLDHDTTEESLAAQLPEYMPKDPESGNFRLLSTIGEQIDSLDSDLSSIDRASTVQTADTTEQLDRLARMVDLKPLKDETVEHFRARVIAEYQLVTSQGTVSDLLTATSTILDTDVNSIGYTEEHTTAAGNARLSVPLSKLNNLVLSDADFSDIVKDLIPAGYRIDVLKKGTFTYVSESTYTDESFVPDPNSGYTGLDSEGNVNSGGGTYAGVL